MTGRERLSAILHRKPADRLSWTTLVDAYTLNALPEPLRGMGVLDFYRHIGCDILLLNTWGIPHAFNSPRLRWSEDIREEVRQENGRAFRRVKTKRGVLTSESLRGRLMKRLVGTREEIFIYRGMWEGAEFVEEDDRAAYAAAEAAVGEDGVVTRFWGISTIPNLLELDMGIENFYYLLHDHPREMEELIGLMHERELKAFEILARGPCEVVILAENTSTYYISPDVYRRYNGPHVRDFVEIMHRAGKIAIIHMCGHVLDILPDIKQTGLDGVHALTPPPTGNTPWERALDVLGEDTIIFGALDPTIFVMGPVEGIGRALDEVYTPRLRRAHFVLGPFADGIPVPLERFLAIGEWMKENGTVA
jgi:hypothetical protein